MAPLARPSEPPALAPERRCTSIPDVLRWRAMQEPDRVGYRFLADGESRAVTMTYGDLDRRARAIASRLRSVGASRRPVLLVYPPGLDFVCAWFGCAYARAVAVAVRPPQSGLAGGRRFMTETAAVAGDACPAVALTTSAILAGLPADRPEPLRETRWLAADTAVDEPPPGAVDEPTVGADDLAFLQYTSGSTSAPKGVMVTHGNLMENLRAIAATFWRSSDGGSVSWLPPYHDMGLIGGILGPLYVGGPVTLIPPLAFVQRPRRWLQAVSQFQAAVSGGPNFAYDLCVRRISPEHRAGLDLSGWRVAFNGAEPVNPRTLQEFTAHFEPVGFTPEAFKPCYGLAEATLLVSVNARSDPARIQHFHRSDLERNRVAPCHPAAEDARPLASCGQPVATTVIVDPESLRRCAPGRVGEIWLAGPSIAQGYFHRRDESEQTFGAHLEHGTAHDGPFLRTGDLGFLLDGELYVTGRLKDLIIIDGANHYPQDIERTVGTCHPTLAGGDAAAFSVEVSGAEALVVVAAVRRTDRAGVPEVRRAMQRAVSECHDLRIHDVVFVERGRIPKTPSGKVRRVACRAAYLAGTLEA
ncbi:MAG TPA: fatty acyl-AMP ligase, partial [bacterium]|nr:fatty acyl-AMP ligase [bacterium]